MERERKANILGNRIQKIKMNQKVISTVNVTQFEEYFEHYYL